MRFLVAASLSAFVLGALGSLTGHWITERWHLFTRVVQLVVAIVSVSYAVGELLRKPLRVPTRHWLVPQRLGNLGDRRFAAVFGVILGAGFFTIVPFIGFHTLVLWSSVALVPLKAALVLMVFGAMRGLPLLLSAVLTRSSFTLPQEVPLQIIAGYAEADAAAVRILRLVSLLGSAIVILVPML